MPNNPTQAALAAAERLRMYFADRDNAAVAHVIDAEFAELMEAARHTIWVWEHGGIVSTAPAVDALKEALAKVKGETP